MNTTNTAPRLVLGSTSPFRREILQKLGLPFETAAPDVDESARANEPPEQLVARLAEAKARAVAKQFPHALIIGSDQVAVNAGEILGKPHTHARAIEQLQNASGKTVRFLTGLCLYNSATDKAQSEVVPFDVVFRELTGEQIENYLQREQPYNCAGSFKSEALGIALFERLEGEDPNTLIGLPLIRLVRMLENEGVRVL
ncbi:Maf family protein [Sulfuriflexus mobilis]|uniref:Maf family protein n=1 Tax=Sulfuriflexus mobilis TaxID=1811807 RepID=UPI000F84535A|nr:nucleoside triphosphate pyrophosphatase [Sulfuriflexus mobilis]